MHAATYPYVYILVSIAIVILNILMPWGDSAFKKFISPSANKFGEGDVFTGVCLFTGGRLSRSLEKSHGWLPLAPLAWDINTLPLHPLIVTSGGHHWTLVQTCSPPPVLTSSGGHRNTYSWQVGGTHPTGMLSWIVNEIKLVIYVPLVTKLTVVRDQTYITIGLNLSCHS